MYLQDQDRIFFARKNNRRSHRDYKKERRLSSHEEDREDSGQTPFIPFEQAE